MTENTDRGAQEAQEAAREWLNMLQVLAEQIQKQQQNSQQMIQELMNTYMELLNTPGSFLTGQAQQQQQTFQQQAQQQQQAFQQMVQESMNTYMQLFNIPASYAQKSMRIAQEDTPGNPQGIAWDESEHTRDFEGRFTRGEEAWEESEHQRDARGRFT